MQFNKQFTGFAEEKNFDTPDLLSNNLRFSGYVEIYYIKKYISNYSVKFEIE